LVISNSSAARSGGDGGLEFRPIPMLRMLGEKRPRVVMQPAETNTGRRQS
jgi:hypothetical protein